MFIIVKGDNKALSDLANEFYYLLNPVNRGGGSLSKNSLKKRIEKKYNAARSKEKKYFYSELIKSKFALLNKIIVSIPKDLTTIVNNFDQLINQGKIPPFFSTAGGKISSTDFGEEVLELFNYKACRGSKKFVWLVKELGVPVCPYCNYEHTFAIRTLDEDTILHDFDHFVPKVIAPYLSLSFFNLIPSCHNCNSTLKGTTVFSEPDYIHPYSDNFHSLANFSIDNPLKVKDPNAFQIKFTMKTGKAGELSKIGNYLSVFKIQARYNQFKSDIVWLDEMKEIYTEGYKQQLLNNGIMGRVFKDRSDLIQFIAKTLRIPLDPVSASRMERGKLKLDIANEFRITT